MKKVVRLSESQLNELIEKIVKEQASFDQIMKLPNCSDKKDEELNGGVLVKTVVPSSNRAAAISQSFNKEINRAVNIYVVKDKKPFCKYR